MDTRKFVDLHVHSNASDGTYSPAEVVELSRRAGLSAIALTDHDTTAGLYEAAACAKEYPDIALIPGIELSAEFSPGIMHILGLGIDPDETELKAVTEKLRESRRHRNPRIVDKLRDMGIDISYPEVLEISRKDSGPDAVVGRLHIAIALMKKGYVKDISEAFEKYIGNHAPAYVVKDHTAPSVAISAIKSAGGSAILAHPSQLECENEAQFERIVRQLMYAGLDGIECYHSTHSDAQTRLYLDVAKRYKLVTTGGSDYHGGGKPDVALGRPKVTTSMVGEELIRHWSQAF